MLTPTLLQFQRHDLFPSGGDSHETYFGAYQFRHQSPIAAKHSTLDSKFEIVDTLCTRSSFNNVKSRGNAHQDRIERKMITAIISVDVGIVLFSVTKILNFMVNYILHVLSSSTRNAGYWERESSILKAT